MKSAITASSVLIILGLPLVAGAQTTPYSLLAPILGVTSISTFGEYLQLLFRGTIGIAGVLAVVMLVTCGIKLMTSEAISSKGEAKECITNAILGLLLAISSWLILNTINPTLLNTNLGIVLPNTQTTGTITRTPKAEEIPYTPGWYFQYSDTAGNRRFQSAGSASDGAEVCQSTMESFRSRGYTILPTTIAGVSKECFLISPSSRLASADELAMRNSICGQRAPDGCIAPAKPVAGRVYINKSACPNPKTREANCTSVGGLDPAALSMIQSIAAGSGCYIIITGGTERNGHVERGGTSDHAIGNATFDLAHGLPCIDNYIKRNGLNRSSGGSITPAGISACPGGRSGTFCGNLRWYHPSPSGGSGFWFIEERYNDKGNVRPHWHVCRDGATGIKGNPSAPTSYCNNPPR